MPPCVHVAATWHTLRSLFGLQVSYPHCLPSFYSFVIGLSGFHLVWGGVCILSVRWLSFALSFACGIYPHLSFSCSLSVDKKPRRVSRSSGLIIVCVSKWFTFPYPLPESPAAPFFFLNGCPLCMVIAVFLTLPSRLAEKLKTWLSPNSLRKSRHTCQLLTIKRMVNAL